VAGYLKSHGITANPGAVEAAITLSGQTQRNLTNLVRDGHILNLKSMADYVGQNLNSLNCH
jgi:hypothetical protein